MIHAEIRYLQRFSIDQMPAGAQLSLIVTLSLKKHNHHLLVQFLKLYHFHLFGKVVDERNLMIFEEFDVFEKESYKFVVTGNTIKRLYFQKLIKFLFGRR